MILALAACVVVPTACRPRAEKPAPVATASRPAAPAPGAQRFHLGTHSRAVTTSNPEAQRAFDRGLVLAFAFNHGAAERELRKAAELDPALAMAWWGVALVNGPHINNPAMSPEQSVTAWDALTKARERAPQASKVEQELITALSKRYADPSPAERRALDEAYAAAMRAMSKARPDDADVATLTAEALMDLRPWDLWTHDGKPQPGTDEIVALLERAMALDPKHPGAHHLYIHTMEASPQPGKATASADLLRDLVPGAGHLVHMPAHVYVRTGRWNDAAIANEKAIEADTAFRRTVGDPGFYFVYMAHNHHFLAFADMMEGQAAEALEAARNMVAGVPEEFLAGPGGPVVDGYLAIPIEVLMRFGKWEEVLAEPEAPGGFPISHGMRVFARASALTALGRMDEADRERAELVRAAAAVPEDAALGNNPGSSLMAIARHVLDGEMAAKRERFDDAIASLRTAAKLEDALKYDEPPDWIQPVRHALGAVLLDAKRPAEAEAAYREDLVRFPENGWSLRGLGRALRAQGKDAEAADIEARFKKAWARADTPIGASCLCRAPK